VLCLTGIYWFLGRDEKSVNMEWVVSMDRHGISFFVVGRVGVGCRYEKKIFSPVEFWCAVPSRFACFVGNTEYYGARGGAVG
jgi:hypothetical protein